MEVVWVFGSSGAGKETLIRSLAKQGGQHAVARYFGWADTPMVVCEDSLRLVAQHENDPALEQRARLAQTIASLANDPKSIILVKGQDVDLERQVPQQVLQQLPQAKHRVLFIDAPAAALLQRWKKKPWWNDDYTLKTVKQWQDYQLGMLAQLPRTFAFFTAQSVDAQMYRVMEGLPAS